MYGDGSQVMDMIYVEDVADILVRTLTVDHGQHQFDPRREEDLGPRFDAGTGRHTTVRGIAEMVGKTVGSGTIKYVPMRKGEPPGSIVLGDPATLKPLYDGELPQLMPLEDGLAETIKWYQEEEEE